jgi:hypothetical protein
MTPLTSPAWVFLSKPLAGFDDKPKPRETRARADPAQWDRKQQRIDLLRELDHRPSSDLPIAMAGLIRSRSILTPGRSRPERHLANCASPRPCGPSGNRGEA